MSTKFVFFFQDNKNKQINVNIVVLLNYIFISGSEMVKSLEKRMTTSTRGTAQGGRNGSRILAKLCVWSLATRRSRRTTGSRVSWLHQQPKTLSRLRPKRTTWSGRFRMEDSKCAGLSNQDEILLKCWCRWFLSLFVYFEILVCLVPFPHFFFFHYWYNWYLDLSVRISVLNLASYWHSHV